MEIILLRSFLSTYVEKACSMELSVSASILSCDTPEFSLKKVLRAASRAGADGAAQMLCGIESATFFQGKYEPLPDDIFAVKQKSHSEAEISQQGGNFACSNFLFWETHFQTF
jgi:hypothetical protein